jgi:hypothetical protein
MHHIISDAASMDILLREVWQIYDSFSAKRSSPLPEPVVQYADYAVWQRQWLQGIYLEKQLAYWTEKLSEAPSLLEMPTDRPRAQALTHRGAKHDLLPSQTLRGKLVAASRREGVTLYIFLLAAFQAMLYLWTGQRDICTKSAIASSFMQTVIWTRC